VKKVGKNKPATLGKKNTVNPEIETPGFYFSTYFFEKKIVKQRCY
jgi:hypothetical protein